jgi:glucose/arabinose dehydrogenase
LLQACQKEQNSSQQVSDQQLRSSKLPGNKAIDIHLVADNFNSPIGLVAVPDNSKRLFVIDQIGKVWIIDASGSRLATPFIDISSRMVSLMPGYDERGLLGLAFHPDYATNGKFYMFYTAPPPPGGPTPPAFLNSRSQFPIPMLRM